LSVKDLEPVDKQKEAANAQKYLLIDDLVKKVMISSNSLYFKKYRTESTGKPLVLRYSVASSGDHASPARKQRETELVKEIQRQSELFRQHTDKALEIISQYKTKKPESPKFGDLRKSVKIAPLTK
jgi:hypothetical protein